MRAAIHPGFNPTDPGDLAGMVTIVSGFSVGPIDLLTELAPAKFARFIPPIAGAVFGAAQFGPDFLEDYQKSGDFWGAVAKQGSKDFGGAVVVTAVGILVPFPADIVACDLASHMWDDIYHEDWTEDFEKYGAAAVFVGAGNVTWKAAGQVMEDGAGVVGNAWKYFRLPPIDLTSAVPDIKVPDFSLPPLNIEAPSIGWPW